MGLGFLERLEDLVELCLKDFAIGIVLGEDDDGGVFVCDVAP